MPASILQPKASEKMLPGFAKRQGNPRYICSHDKEIGSDLLRQLCTGQIFVDHRIDPVKHTAFLDHGDSTASTRDDNEAHFDQSSDFTFFHNADGLRGGDNPSIALGCFHRGIRKSGRHLFCKSRSNGL